MISIEKLHQHFLECTGVSTDSRKIREGCIFFALRGENFDGNDFAAQAIEQGARFVVVDDAKFKKIASPQFIFVPNVLAALQQLANYHRHQFQIPVIAITGSNGKTTTKALCATILSGAYKTLFTQGNLNNHIGVPLTLLQLTAAHEVAVIEMGANHQGEINALCAIAAPTHGLITNMGKAHLEGFGGEEGVRIGKSEMYRYLNAHNGTIFFNANEPHLKNYIPERTKSIAYEVIESDAHFESAKFQFRLEQTQPFLGGSFYDANSGVIEIKTQIIGAYNAANIATAVCLGKYFKVPAHKIAQQINNFQPSDSRSEIKMLSSGATLIMDAYNANPSSMRVALDNLGLSSKEKKIAILGDMFELGDAANWEHEKIIAHAETLNLSALVTVGKNFSLVKLNHRRIDFDNTDAAHSWFAAQTFDANTIILLKGSRSMMMEKVVADVL